MNQPPRVCAKCGAQEAKPNNGYCKDCHREYMREWTRAKRANLIATLSPCIQCGKPRGRADTPLCGTCRIVNACKARTGKPRAKPTKRIEKPFRDESPLGAPVKPLLIVPNYENDTVMAAMSQRG